LIRELWQRAGTWLARLVGLGRRRRKPALRLPAWAQVRRKRHAHIRRVAALVEEWAEAMQGSQRERRRGLTAVWLHDALRDARLPAGASHGAAAAERAAQDGEADRGVLDAVRYHSVGYADWDDVGKMLYLADYLEPGRRGRQKERGKLAERVPRERDDVLREVVARDMEERLRDGRPIDPLTIAFWNSLTRR